MSSFMSLDKKGRTTLPEEVREALGVKAGDFLLLEHTERGTFELVPASLVPIDQLWFHHPEMQHRIREAEESVSSGRAKTTRGARALLRHLESLKRPGGKPRTRKTRENNASGQAPAVG